MRGVTDLATVRPDLAAEWHPAKNGNLAPGDVIAGTARKVWWLCAQGHEWEARSDSRVRGNGCPYCSHKRALTGYNDLATMDPKLALEWHPTRNGDLTPSLVMAGEFWWLCGEGHEWEAPVTDRRRGRGCPYCSGRLAIVGETDLETTNPEVAAEWHPIKNGNLTPRDVKSSTNKKAWWLCSAGHEWETKIANRHSGTGCPYCSGRLAIVGETDLATMDPKLALEWHPTKNGGLLPRDVMSGAGKKTWWLCDQGHEWEATINSRHRGNGCPFCSGHFVIDGETDLATVHPDVALDWHPTKNGALTPRDVPPGTTKKAWWLCDQGHEWEAQVNSRRIGSGCPVCAGKRVLVGFNDLATTNPGLAAEWHPTKNGVLTARDVTSGSNKRAWWLCSEGHEWEAVTASRNNGYGCPYCSGRFAIVGETDLLTTNPGLAAEFHASKNRDVTSRNLTSNSGKKVWWLCDKGHEWKASVGARARGSGCPRCAKTGFDQTSPAYLYLLRKDHDGLQQFGITNKPKVRLAKHRKNGWEVINIIGPADGVWIVETETALGRFFRDKGLLLPRDYPDKFDGYSESWRSDQLSFSTCAEMLEALRDWEKKV